VGNLDIARSRRGEDVRILRTKLAYAEAHLNDNQCIGGLGPDFTRMAQSQRQAKLESIEGLKAQIAELESLGEDALKARYCPDVLRPPVNKSTWLGPVLQPV
jgi:hypothetical protein